MSRSSSVSSWIRLAVRFPLPAMRWFDTFVLAGTAGFAAAHGNGLPRIAGDPRLSAEFTASKRWGSASDLVHGSSSARREIDENTNTNGRCGKDFDNASCAPGYCCSVAGWCGNDKAYCWAPDCQIDFGPGCDGNKKPKGEDTSDVPRPRVGNVPYGGTGIYRCVYEGDIALTYDDGPFDHTGDLLDVFKNFSQMTDEQARNQVIWNEIAINDILGYFPTYLRPPYSICPEKCQSMLEDLGYHIIYFNLDTEGYLHDDPTEIQESKVIWDEHVEGSNPCNTSYLAIEHDLQKQVVYNLTEYMLKSLIDNGYRPVTVGECLGDPPENWYRAGRGEVPEYTYTPLTPTGTYSCLPDRASETGTATPTGPTPSGDTTSTSSSPTASGDEQTSSSETNSSSNAEGGESPEATGSAEPAGSTDATESTQPDSAASSPYSARMVVYFVAVALSLCIMGA
ncbi:hypothetical protein DL767_010526 [Monosporascus sp. MG133]|nr:hypothetical protein DL767_010526 [Monosporascus sp. MG133]